MPKGMAAPDGSATPERAVPARRAAILVGVKTYRPDNYRPDAGANTQMLQNLNTPCEDVEEISKQLQLAGWSFDDSDPHSEIHTYCNGDLSAIRSDIEQRVVELDRPGDLLLIFFAGHGAEVGGRSYFFGPSARIDLAAEVRRLNDWSINRLFVGQALDINETVMVPAGLTYHGNLLVILGACRDDPVTYSTVARALHLEVGPPVSAIQSEGVRVLYATTPGKKIADGVGLSYLARAFSAHVGARVRVYSAIADARHDVIAATKNTMLEDPLPVGDLNEIDLCFSGCGAGQAMFAPRTKPNPFIRKVSTLQASDRTDQPNDRPEGYRVVRALPTSDRDVSRTAAPISFDIYWCESGGYEKHRRDAESLARDIAALADGDRPTGAAIGVIRTKPLADSDNSRPGFRFSRNAIRYSAENQHAGALAKIVKHRFIQYGYVEPIRSSGLDVVNIFLCSGGPKFPKSPRLFMQAASPNQRGIATFIATQIERRNQDVWVADGVDIRPRVQEISPEHTMVKYFDEHDKPLASRIAESLNVLLPSPTRTVFAPPEKKGDDLRGLVEVWLGRDLRPGDVRTGFDRLEEQADPTGSPPSRESP
ncbi:caspase family protein [Burkholderia lata]|uniref:caspase family protein n=1 Tax=Burkholderia lata (strain ATCC 17760 / DSM 23089 / LMG 22485 / NCIMB 9086 / R18194 / 383) TaxID=482957 RepID=UPI0018D4A4B8|nr:caspase family protein [Burkholderia lata]